MDNIKELQNLLDQVASIVKKYDDLALQSGEKFNVFDIIGLRNDEVRMHSAMLANLLDAQGSHGMKGKFLELFIKMLEEKNGLWEKSRESSFSNPFKNDINDTNCISELYTGPRTEDEGGRIDLYIYDSNNKALIIENKIKAPEQYKQLIRYNNFNKEAPILFLTLNGDKPSSSIDEFTKKDISKSVYCISYKTDILKWLESCHKEASDKPLIREGIKHYINLIKIITNQTMSKSMEKEIFKIIVKNPELVSNLSNNTFDLISNEKFVKTLIFIRESLHRFDLLSLNFEENKNLGKEDSGIDFLVNENYKLYYYFEYQLDGLHIFITFKNKDKIDSILSSKKLEEIFDLSKENILNTGYIEKFEIGIPISNYNKKSWVELNNPENINDISMKIDELKKFLDSQF